jgi:hypothetical protein
LENGYFSSALGLAQFYITGPNPPGQLAHRPFSPAHALGRRSDHAAVGFDHASYSCTPCHLPLTANTCRPCSTTSTCAGFHRPYPLQAFIEKQRLLPPLFSASLCMLLCMRAAPHQAMSSMSHQAKHHRSCRLVSSFASSERAPSSCGRVNKHQSAKPPSAIALHVDSSPPVTIRRPSTSASSAPAPRCSLTQSPGASTPHPSQHRQFSIFSFFRGHLTMDVHLRSFPGPAATAKMSASTSRTSSTTSLALVTNGPTPHQCCPPLDRRCRRKSYPGELPTPLAPQINSPRCPIALATTPAPPRRWASPDLAGAAAGRRGEQAPPFPPWAASPSRGRPITEAG